MDTKMKSLFTSIKILSLCLIIINFDIEASKAGPFTDNLSTCAIRSLSDSESEKLVTWLFMVISQHSDITNEHGQIFSESQQIRANRNMGSFVNNILLTRCGSEFKEAVKFEGMDAFFELFQRLGEAAMYDFMADPNVLIAAEGYVEYLDLEALFQGLN